MTTNTELLALMLVSNNTSYIIIVGVLGDESARFTLGELEVSGLIKGPENAKSNQRWLLTEKGSTYISMMLNTPEPIASWKDPREKK